MTPADKDLVLGYDFGTSSVKAALFDRDGNVVASGTASYPLLLPQPGWAEQRPADWWKAMAEVTRDVLASAKAHPSRIGAAGIAAQMCGVVPVAEDGTALHNALLWLDTRSHAIAERLMGGWPRINGYGILPALRWLRITGGAPNLSGKDPLTKMLWFRETMPELWARTRKVLDVKDAIVQRCTGRFVTSYDTAHVTWLFDPGRKRWSPHLTRRTGIGAERLPEAAPATESAGDLGPAAAEWLGLAPGTVISVGAGDIAAAALGAGLAASRAPHLCVGTSSWLAARLPHAKVDPFTNIGTLRFADGDNHLLIATQENAGSCVTWALGALGFGAEAYQALEEAAGSAQPEADAPLFLPWLHGERVPAEERALRAGFLSLGPGHGRNTLARAILEGVALNIAWAAPAFDRMTGQVGRSLRLGGGGAKSALWCQILADVLQRPIERVASPELCGARGAAMTAAVTAGWYADLEAAAAMTRRTRTFHPEAGLQPLYDRKLRRFTAAFQKLRPWYRRFGTGPDGRA